MKKKYDAVIIGAGPAGVTAAIYLARSDLKVAIIEKEKVGGQVNKTSVVENYPSYTTITGPQLAEKFKHQLDKLELDYIEKEVKHITPYKKKKVIVLKNRKKIETKAIILAPGRKPKKLTGTTLEGKGISYCSLADGDNYKKEDVAIIGSGNSALEESLYLSDICSSVTVLCRSEKLKGDKILIRQIKKKGNIKVLYNTTVEGFNGKKKELESITIKEKEKLRELKVKACFIFIGYEPATDFLQNLDILDENGYIIVDNCQRTKIEGIYAAGDVVKKEAFQIVTATSDGAQAAITAIKETEV